MFNRTLIPGSNGLVGSNLLKKYREFRTNTSLLHPLRNDLDLSKREKVFEYFRNFRPDLVFLLGILDSFQLGNLNAQRDIGHAREYVEGMWKMLQRETPEDYVLSTGKTHTVREIVNKTAFLLGMDIKWEGEGINEICLYQGKKIISIDSKYFRPAEVDLLIGDSSKARNELGWESKMTIYDILKEMIDFQIHKRKP